MTIEEVIKKSFKKCLLIGNPYYVFMTPETFKKFMGEMDKKSASKTTFNGGKLTFTFEIKLDHYDSSDYDDDLEFELVRVKKIGLEVIVSASFTKAMDLMVIADPGNEAISVIKMKDQPKVKCNGFYSEFLKQEATK